MLDAGSVFTTLGGRFNPAAFRAFDSANKTAAATMNASEAKITASQARTAASARRTAKSVAASATEETAARQRAAGGAASASAEATAADTRRAASARRAARAKTAAAGEEVAASRRASAATTAAAAQVVAAEQRKSAAARASAAVQMAAARQAAGALALVDRAQLSLYGKTELTEQANERSRASLAAVGKGARVGALGVAAFAAVAATKGVTSAAALEEKLNLIQVNARATGDEMSQVSAKAIELGADLQLPATSAADAAEVMLELVKGGFSVQQAMDAARGGLALGAAANIENARATEIAVDTLRAFNLEARDAGRVADVLAAGAIASSVEVPQLAAALQQTSAAARDAGLSVEDTVGALIRLSNAGIKGSDAGTSLKTMLLALSPNSREAAEKIKELGVEAYDAEGNIRPFTEVLDRYSRSLGELSRRDRTEALKTIFGQDAYRAASILFERGAQAQERAVRAVQRHNAATDVAAARMDGYKGAQEAVNNAWETGSTIVGTALLPKLTELANKAAELGGRWIEDGGAAQLGEDIADGFDVALQVLGQVAAVGGDVAGVLADIGGALQLGDADVLLALGAGFTAFKTAGVVAPMVMSLATAMNALILNARTAPSLAAFFASLPIGPVGLLSGALAAAAGGLALWALKSEDAADKARATAEAFREQAAAMRELDDALLSAADAQFGAERADRALADAKDTTSRALRRYGRDSKEYRDALAAEREAGYRSAAAHERVADERGRVAEEEKRTREAAAKAITKAEAERDKKTGDAQRELMNALRRGDGDAQSDARRKIIDAWKDYNAAVQAAAAGSAKAAISQIQLNRLMQGQRLLTDGAATSVAKLARVYDALPRRTQVQLAASSEGALTEIGDLVGQLRNVPRQQVVNILAKANGAQSQIAALKATLAGVPARKVVEILSKTNNAKVQIAAVTAAAAGVPQQRIVRILENGALPARVKIAALTAAVRGVPPSKITQILENGALSAKQKVDALTSAINGMPGSRSSTITVTTINRTINETINRISRAFAGGRPAGGVAEAAIVGEGNDWRGAREAIVDRRTGQAVVVDRPTMMQLSPDSYVIPLEENRAGALGLAGMLADDLGGGAPGLMRMLAGELGVQAFARGRAAARRRAARRGGRRRARAIPGVIDPLALPVDGIESVVRDRESKLSDARRVIESNPGEISTTKASIRDIERRKASTRAEKANKADDLARGKKKLRSQEKELRAARRTGAKLKRELENLRKALSRARSYQRKIDEQTDLANLARQDMTIADNRDDQPAYEAARGRRTTALRELERLLRAARGHIKSVSRYQSRGDAEAYKRKVDEAIKGAVIDQQDTADDEFEVEEPEETPAQRAQREASERLADTGMTDAERQRWQEIKAAKALARLTAGLDDDTGSQRAEVDFLQGILSAVQADPARGGAGSVEAIASDLAAAQENLRSLTGGGGTNSDSDVQAQLDQERRRREDSEARERGMARELAVFGSSGDIGAGGYANAHQAGGQPSVVQNFNLLHPGDPALLRAIGGAAVAGIGYQGGRPSPRTKVGV